MDTKIALCLPNSEYQKRMLDVQYFLKCVLEFYIEAATQIKKCSPIVDQVLDANTKHSEYPSTCAPSTKIPK